VAAVAAEDSVVVGLVVEAGVDTSEAGVDTSEADLVAAEAERASADPDSVVARVTSIAEACVSLIRAPARCVLRFIDRPLWPGRIAE
jgi:hypothetical protein